MCTDGNNCVWIVLKNGNPHGVAYRTFSAARVAMIEIIEFVESGKDFDKAVSGYTYKHYYNKTGEEPVLAFERVALI